MDARDSVHLYRGRVSRLAAARPAALGELETGVVGNLRILIGLVQSYIGTSERKVSDSRLRMPLQASAKFSF